MESHLEEAEDVFYMVPRLGVSIIEQFFWILWPFEQQDGQLKARL